MLNAVQAEQFTATFWSFDAIPGTRTAVIQADGAVVTYADLAELADQWARRYLEAAGTTRPMIALEFPTTLDAIAAYLGALRAELPVLVGSPGQFAADSALVQAWQPGICVTDEDGTLMLASHALDPTTTASVPPSHADLALLLSTSGTTGDPKLVRLSRTNIASNATSIAEYLSLTANDCAPTTLPLFYSYGLSVLNSYLAVGASLMLTERSVTEAAFWDDFRAFNGTSLALVPHQFDLLAAANFAQQDLPTLRYLTQAGGRLPEARVRHFAEIGREAGWELFVMYGQTEAAPRMSFVPPAALPGAADTIGQAIPGGRLWVADDKGHEIAAAGTAGELVYEGPNVMMGYALTRADLALDAGEPVLRTGDIAERTAEGFFRIVGRSKRFVKLFGLRISLDQVEKTLSANDIAAHAISIDDRLVLLHLDADQGDAAIALIAETYDLPTSAVHVVHLEEVPLLPSRKPDEQAMRRLAGNALDARDAVPAAQTADIASLLMQATRRRSIQPGDSFNSLGGDSLSYIQVQVGLEERLGKVPDGWEEMTLAQLEAMVRTEAAPTLRKSEVGIDLILRIFALGLIIAQHASSSYPLYGGTWMLLTLMGYSAARFQLATIAQARPLRLAVQMLYPIVPIYLVIMVVYQVARHDTPLVYYLFVANYVLTSKSLLTVYWFVSCYVQIVLLLVLVAAIGPVRRVVVSHPWESAATLLTVMLVIAGVWAAAGTHVIDDRALHAGRLNYRATHGFIECLPMFLVGWMLRRMKTTREKWLTVAFAVVEVVMFATLQPPHEAIVFLILCNIVVGLSPRLYLPLGVARLVQRASAATLFLYLFHEMAVYFVWRMNLPELTAIALSVPLAFATAMIAKAVFDMSEQRVMVHRRAAVA